MHPFTQMKAWVDTIHHSSISSYLFHRFYFSLTLFKLLTSLKPAANPRHSTTPQNLQISNSREYNAKPARQAYAFEVSPHFAFSLSTIASEWGRRPRLHSRLAALLQVWMLCRCASSGTRADSLTVSQLSGTFFIELVTAFLLVT